MSCPLISCGINHHTAPIEIRERLVFDKENAPHALHDVLKLPAVNEAVILSTCNRTEIYSVADNLDAIYNWFLQQYPSLGMDIKSCCYIYQDVETVQHLMRVASGLDSMILGEPQILGQIKQAYQLACQNGGVGKQFRQLFPAVFAVSKEIRRKTQIGNNPISIAYATILLAKRIFTKLSNCKVLLIGAGELIELMATHLINNGVKQLIIANRTIEKAQQLAGQFQGLPICIREIPHYLREVNIVVTATASQLPLIGKGMVEEVLKKQKRRPIFMADLAVPRDVEVQVGDLEDVYLYNIDDLRNIVEENLQNRHAAAEQAEAMISIKASHFMRKLHVLNASDIIKAFRGQVEVLRDQELNNALISLQQGENPTLALTQMAHRLTNKILHQPTVKLRKAAYNEEFELLMLAKELLEL